MGKCYICGLETEGYIFMRDYVCDVCFRRSSPSIFGNAACTSCASLRDRFAMAALTGMLAGGGYDIPGAVEDAFHYADLMMEKRRAGEE